jgi:hypothetical protein
MRSLLALSFGAVTLLACGGSPPPPSSPTPGDAKPASSSAPSGDAKGAGSADDAAKKAAVIEKMTADEAKSGECTADHKAALDKLVSDYESAMKAKAGDDGKPLGLQTVGKKVLALGTSARGVELSVTGRGTEVHVIAFGVRDVSMDVLAGTAAATTMRSPLQKAVPAGIDLPAGHADLQNDSREIVIKPGQPLQVKLTGQGCAAMISFVKP